MTGAGVKFEFMERQERGPVAEQGMSRNYKAYDPEALIGRRAFRTVWIVELVLIAGFAGLGVWVASSPNAPAVIGPSFLLVGLPAGVWLREPARRRAYPSLAVKCAALIAVLAFVVGYVAFVLVGLDVIALRMTSTSSLILLEFLTYTVTLVALVLAYRARFFYWRVS